MQALGLDHIDLMLIHSPQPWAEFREGDRYFEGNAEAWRALEDAHRAGKLRAIGVSNFERADIENLLATGTLAPMANQVLAHVGNTPFDLIDYCRSSDILVEAYSPVAHGAVLKDAGLQAIAERYGVSVRSYASATASSWTCCRCPRRSTRPYARQCRGRLRDIRRRYGHAAGSRGRHRLWRSKRLSSFRQEAPRRAHRSLS